MKVSRPARFVTSADAPLEIEQEVIITLATGKELRAYWDGEQWWSGDTDSNFEVPIANAYVVSWRKG